MKIKIKHIKNSIKFLLSLLVSRLIIKKNKIFMIGERKNEAKDNGYHLFKYIRESHPSDRVYYVIDKDSNDYLKVSKLGNVIKYNSVRHYIFIFITDKFICAHLGSCLPDTPLVWKACKDGVIKGKKIFIQHGITISDHDALKYNNSGMDMFICGAKPEYEYVRDNFAYPKGAVKYLGFCRFDNLHNFEVKNQILVMPTWRGWLGQTWGKDDYDIFLSSEYYKRFYALINNKKLLNFLEVSDTQLIFYPHYEMQKYIAYFKSTSKQVIIAKKEKYDVQQLLKESKMLITDYSSVAFDFAYMKKPIIYYQFDKEEYYDKHYKEGYFNYDDHGFGKTLSNEECIVDEIIRLQTFNIDYKYLERMKYFFPLHDNKNCERYYKYIIIKD